MPTPYSALVALVVYGLLGCNVSAYKPFNEASAMSQLRKFSTAQAFASVEYGEYIHGLPLLYQRIGTRPATVWAQRRGALPVAN